MFAHHGRCCRENLKDEGRAFGKVPKHVGGLVAWWDIAHDSVWSEGAWGKESTLKPVSGKKS